MKDIAKHEVDLAKVKEQFESWRQNRKGRQPIPEVLWQAATGLSKHYSINKIAKELGLGYSALKKRVAGLADNTKSPFVELKLPESAFPSAYWTVEMEKPDGAKLKMCYQGHARVELFEIGKAFWSHDQ